MLLLQPDDDVYYEMGDISMCNSSSSSSSSNSNTGCAASMLGSRARKRWLLTFTLINNPSLIKLRKHRLFAESLIKAMESERSKEEEEKEKKRKEEEQKKKKEKKKKSKAKQNTNNGKKAKKTKKEKKTKNGVAHHQSGDTSVIGSAAVTQSTTTAAAAAASATADATSTSESVTVTLPSTNASESSSDNAFTVLRRQIKKTNQAAKQLSRWSNQSRRSQLIWGDTEFDEKEEEEAELDHPGQQA